MKLTFSLVLVSLRVDFMIEINPILYFNLAVNF